MKQGAVTLETILTILFQELVPEKILKKNGGQIEKRCSAICTGGLKIMFFFF